MLKFFFKKNTYYLNLIIAFLIFLILMTLTGFITYTIYISEKEKKTIFFEKDIERLKAAIARDWREYETLLSCGEGLFAASKSVEPEEWKRFVKTLNLADRYTGIHGLGFIAYVPGSKKQQYLAEVSELQPDFLFKPEGERKDYYIIQYIEPLENNLQARGYDVGSETIRREGAEKAASSAKSCITGKIFLVQDQVKTPGLLFFHPVYRHYKFYPTEEDRRSNLLGFIYMPLNINKMMRHILENLEISFDFKIFDGEFLSKETWLYDSQIQYSNSVFSSDFSCDKKIKIQIAERCWTLLLNKKKSFYSESFENYQFLTIFMGGILLSFFGFFLALSLVLTKIRATRLAEEITKDLSELNILQKAILDSAHMSIISTDINGIIRTFNKAAEKMLGYNEEEVIGKLTPAPFHDQNEMIERAKSLSEEYHKTVQVGFDVFVTKAQMVLPDEMEWTYIHKNGHRFPVLLSITAIRNPKEEITGYLGIALDITTRKESEFLLQKLSLVASKTDNAVVITNKDGAVDWVNEGFTKLTGYMPYEIQGKRPGSVLQGPLTDPKSVQKIREAFHHKQNCYIEIVNYHKEGYPYWLSISMSPVFDSKGELINFIAIESNITKRKESEEKLKEYAKWLESVNKDLDQFAYVVSHDLKAPLRAISSLSQWIREDAEDILNENCKKNLDLMCIRVQRMENLINGILEYSKIGRTKIQKQKVNITILLKDIIDMLGIPPEFSVEISSNMPEFNVEKIEIQQVFSNFLSNAIKYHHKKTGHIRIFCTETPNFYEFGVSDDGPGIDPQFHSKLFVLFQTLEARDKFESTGLGLAIVKKIVESHSGCVRIESERGKGATFYFTWPKQEQDPKIFLTKQNIET